MKNNAVVVGSAVVLILVPLALIWYSRRGKHDTNDRMDETQVVRKKKEKIIKTTKISKEDVRFVIGRKGCVVKDIEGRCGVKVSFPEDTDETTQIVAVKGDCNDDIIEAIEMIQEACQLKPKIITEHIEIRAEFCGKIIGKGGDNLQGIREKSGTRILITKEPVNGNADLRLCSIEGTKEEIDIAKEMIDCDIMTEIEIRHRRKHKQAIKDYKTYEKASNGNMAAPIQVNEIMESVEEQIPTNRQENISAITEKEVELTTKEAEVTHQETKEEAVTLVEQEIVLTDIEPEVALPTIEAEEDALTCSLTSASQEEVLPILEANEALSSLVKEAVAPIIEPVAHFIEPVPARAVDAQDIPAIDVQDIVIDVRDIEIDVQDIEIDVRDIEIDVQHHTDYISETEQATMEQELSLPTVATSAQPLTNSRPTDLPASDYVTLDSMQKTKEMQRQTTEIPEPIKVIVTKVKVTKSVEGERDETSETESVENNTEISENNTEISYSTSIISRDLEGTATSEYTLDSNSTNFSFDSTSYDKCSSDSLIQPALLKLGQHIEQEDGSAETAAVIQDDITPTSEGAQLPHVPISTSQDIGSDSIETLVPGTPPNSMLLSGLSHVSSGESVVNNTLTLHLKSMLGIQTNNGSPSAKGHTVPVEAEIKALLDTTLNTALDVSQALHSCSISTFNNDKVTFPDEFEGIITSALCSNHIWVIRNYTNCILQKMLTSTSAPNAVDTIKIRERYLFVNKPDDRKYRVQSIQEISPTVTECFDIDTGLELSVPTSCLFQLPAELSLIPPAAVCVSIGSGPCDKVHNSELIGKVVTVTRVHMGANKDVKYPRVKLHCGDQILYSNYRYVPSPHNNNSSLPPGSSLVYVSAIHNAGHFYVQVCGKNISELDRLETGMAEHYGSVDTAPDYTWTPVTGQLCGVWHTSEQIWLRGQVKELDNSNMLYIKYLDYGDTVHVPRSYIRKLKSEFKEVPYQAIECFLANTIPITTRQWTPDATAKFDALTRCGQWYPLRCVVVGERHGKPYVELYDQPYSDKEYSVGESLCAMDYARSSKLEKPIVQTLSTPIPSFASGAAYLVSPDFDDVDDELEELFACEDDSDSADSDDFPVSRANVSNILMSLSNQISPSSAQWCKNTARYRPQTCGSAKNNAFMERPESTDSEHNSSDPATPKAQRKMRSYKTQESLSDSDNLSESDQSYFQTPLGTSPKSTTSSYASAADFNSTFVPAEHTTYHDQSIATPLHLSSAEDTDCG